MAQCPVCNAKIPDDFGLIECPSCSAQLIVHMDGRVEYSGANADADPESSLSRNPAPKDPPPDFGEAIPEIEIPADTPNLEAENPDASEFGHDFQQPNEEVVPTVLRTPPQDEEVMGDFHASEPLPPAEFEPVAEAEPSPVPDDPFAMVPDNPETEVYRPNAPPVASDSPDLSDIARFGNSDQASGRDGSLRYNLFITGIDTADVREAFREAITDRKLVWDIDQILRSLKNGEVEIQNVTPPKAYILISRLRNIPVQVRWEQYALAQT